MWQLCQDEDKANTIKKNWPSMSKGSTDMEDVKMYPIASIVKVVVIESHT